MADMTKLIVGDMHCREKTILPAIDDMIAERDDINGIVILGDTQDAYGATTADRVDAARLLARFADTHHDIIRLLMGNHDLPYIVDDPGPMSYWSPGFDPDAYHDVHEAYRTLDWAVATVIDAGGDWLCSHAGVRSTWAVKHGIALTDAVTIASDVNALLTIRRRSGLRVLNDVGEARGGRGIGSPLWADLSELDGDPVSGLRQIVGHTPVPSATLMTMPAEHVSIWHLDTMDSDRTVLLAHDDGAMEVKRLSGVEQLVRVGA